ncbi:MAG: hypothetical protein LC768_13220 [Acidobacteria bacterium]|nr:hypothetical protein [Acidobacteriota bacterium]MCA1639272.1 hypothetical protein [Acidobacteriota bacterium]
MRKSVCFVILIVAVFSGKIFAQTTSQQQEAQRTIGERQAQQREFGKFKDVVQPKAILAKRAALPFKTKRTREQNKRLSPDAGDLSKFALFLRQPKTGLVKLFSDLGCEDNANVIYASEECLRWIPNSAFYSFREREHTNEYLSDLRVEKGNFISDGILSQGILVSLSDASLDNLTLNSNGMKFLVDFAPEANSKEALRQTQQLTKGVKSNGFVYKKSLPVVENTTYAMRVVAYRGKFFRFFRGFNFNVLDGDERADLIVAFQVVGKPDNGSVTLLWKELQRKEAPKVIFPQKSKK